MNTLWKKNGLILKKNRVPTLCDKCPCKVLVPVYYTPYSYAHYANGTSTAGQRLNRLTMTVNGHSFEMVLSGRSHSSDVVSHEIGLNGFTGDKYTSSFRSEDGSASVSFSVYLCTVTSYVCDRVYQGKFYNYVLISGSAVVDDSKYYMDGEWRNLTNAPISEGGAVINGVPLPFDLDVSVEDGRHSSPVDLALSVYTVGGSIFSVNDSGWYTEAKGAWVIGPARYDETVQWVYYI